MSDQLKVGDRAKIVPDTDGQIYTGAGIVFARQQDINGLEGEVKYVDDIWGSAHIQTDNGVVLDVCQQCLTRVETTRRTFEEIVKELVEKLKPEWNVEISDCGAAHVVRENNVHCIVGCRGDVEVFPTFSSAFITPSELAAISAACTEIAANYAAEIGKEDA